MRRELRKSLCVLMAAITLSSSIQLPVRASGPAGEVQETAAEDIIIEETATEEITIEETASREDTVPTQETASQEVPDATQETASSEEQTSADEIVTEEERYTTEDITQEETEEDGIAPHIMDFVEIKDIHAAVTKMFLG